MEKDYRRISELFTKGSNLRLEYSRIKREVKEATDNFNWHLIGDKPEKLNKLALEIEEIDNEWWVEVYSCKR